MEENKDKFEKRKQSLINWFKKPYNLALVGVLLFTFFLRFHYFLMTKSQPLWWDEAVYGSLAKNLVHGGIWDHTVVIATERTFRPPLLPLLWAFFLEIGIGEAGLRFVLEFIPSMLSVFFVYLIGKEMYNKKIGLIAAFIFSVLWIHLFYTARLLTDIPQLAFLFPSVYCFIKSQKHDFNAKYFGISIFLLSLSTLFRFPNGIFFFAYFLFLIITKKFYLIKNKKFWIAGIIGLIPLLIFFSFNYINYNNIFPAFFGEDYFGKESTGPKPPLGFYLIGFVLLYLKTPFLIFFIIGLILILFELVAGYDLIDKKYRLESHLILLLLLITIFSFFIFWLRSAEDRWLFPIALPLSIWAGLGTESVYKFFKQYNKQISIILVLVILAFGAYQQILHADALIKNKKETYLQVRQGFEWIKENTPADSLLLGQSISAYAVYYAERDYLYLPKDYNITRIDEINADYLVVHVFAPQPEYINEYLQSNQDKWQPINGFFFDEAKQQPALIIYKNNFK